MKKKGQTRNYNFFIHVPLYIMQQKQTKFLFIEYPFDIQAGTKNLLFHTMRNRRTATVPPSIREAKVAPNAKIYRSISDFS